MKGRLIAYWVTTGLVALAMLTGGAADVMRPPDAVAGMVHLGYPAYFMVILGVWKLLAGIALLAPRFPRLKEWAYAGTIFDLTGASASHAASGDPAWHIIVPLLIAVIVLVSWALRPESRVLGTIFPAQKA